MEKGDGRPKGAEGKRRAGLAIAVAVVVAALSLAAPRVFLWRQEDAGGSRAFTPLALPTGQVQMKAEDPPEAEEPQVEMSFFASFFEANTGFESDFEISEWLQGENLAQAVGQMQSWLGTLSAEELLPPQVSEAVLGRLAFEEWSVGYGQSDGGGRQEYAEGRMIALRENETWLCQFDYSPESGQLAAFSVNLAALEGLTLPEVDPGDVLNRYVDFLELGGDDWENWDFNTYESEMGTPAQREVWVLYSRQVGMQVKLDLQLNAHYWLSCAKL